MDLFAIILRSIACFGVIFACLHGSVDARIHTLTLKNDVRQYITMSTFGFYKNGKLEVNLKSFTFTPHDTSKVFGFSLVRTITDATSGYLQNYMNKCMLQTKRLQDDNSMAVVMFTMDFKSKNLIVNCSQHLQSMHIYASEDAYNSERLAMQRQRAARGAVSDEYLLPPLRDSVRARHRRSTALDEGVSVAAVAANVTLTSAPAKNMPTQQQQPLFPSSICSKVVIPILEDVRDGITFYSTNFTVSILRDEEEGLYNLNFHNCHNYADDEGSAVNLTVSITELNDESNFLSAGEMPLPALYFTMSILFFLSGCFWVFILRKSDQQEVFKIHYVMAVLVYLKSLNLVFHGIHYHFLQTYGIHIEGWAILDYITHLLKGALMFTTIVLIGTGWAFIKHVFSDKEKKIFMIIVPLQVLDNIAGIIMAESEKGEITYFTWRDIFILVDLLCCGAILFPVIWSIRHLQEASQIDGKAAINLSKLKLFRHFYIMIVCYIYFSRIIVHLLKITVPFQYEWLDEMFYEMAAFVFFVLTGYKFRPASNNPYFQLPQDDEGLEIDTVITHSGITEGLKKVNQHKESEENSSSNRRENSLEYD